MNRRVVFDNNVLISQFLLPGSVPAQSFLKAFHEDVIVVSAPMVEELAEVLARPKFDRYASWPDRRKFLVSLHQFDIASIIVRVDVCRDPDDNRVLETALNGRASLIVTGDKDLLDLDPFHGIRIMRPADYLRT